MLATRTGESRVCGLCVLTDSGDRSLPGSDSLGVSFSWVMAARIVGKAFVLLFLALVARTLGPSRFGAFSYHLAFAQIFAILVDLGLTTAAVREGARDPLRRSQIFGSALIIKLLLVVPVVFLVPALAVGFSAGGKWALALLAVSLMVADSLAAFLWGPFRIRNELRPMALSEVGRALLALLLFVVVSATGRDSAGVALVCYLAGAVGALIVPAAMLRRHGGLGLSRFSWETVRRLLKPGIVIGATSALYVAGNRLDILLLQRMRGPEEVGLYNAAYTLFMNIGGIALLACMVIFPRLATLATTDTAATRRFLLKVLSPMLLLSFPAVIVGPVLAPAVINLLFGAEYSAAGPVLALLFIAAGLVFPGKVLWYLMIASNRQGRLLFYAAGAVALNLALNITLIPHLGGIASALATIVMEAALGLCFLASLRRFLPLRSLAGAALRPGLAAVLT
ncbi:MAG: flippase, partial [Acidobacteriota bacterium]